MDLSDAIWLVIIVAVFCGAVWGGFWVIAKGALGRIATVAFSIIVLVIIVFFLVALVQSHGHFGAPALIR